jgi:hydrogenase nickel incorporation protein HypA/HybF
MHELSICQGLLAEAARVGRAHGASSVRRLSVLVGPLSGVEASQLARAFDVARVGTMAETADLDIDKAPVVVWCARCEAESVVAPNALLCDACGAWEVSLRSGSEMLLKRVDLVVPQGGGDGGRHV